VTSRPWPRPGPKYGLNVTMFEQDYPDVVLASGLWALGFTCRHRKPAAT
jgi:hypothetical protein